MPTHFRFTVLAVIAFAVAGWSGGRAAGLPVSAEGQELPSLAPMLKSVAPGVVNISTRGRVRVRESPLFSDPFFRRFFDMPSIPRERRTQSVGSGVIVDAERGYVITNHHVIANADKIVITLKDRRQIAAELVGSDPDTDVAILKVGPDRLTAVPLGDSNDLEVGDFVIAIGNPFGLGQTVTSGIVSALGRSGLGIEGYEDFIQTDASINPGNSGGALVNLRGELIGINTAILAPGGGNVGIGFAIPVDMAREIMSQLIDFGEVRRGHFGVQVQELTPRLAGAMGIRQTEGAVITRVVPDSPAERSGIKQGDVVVTVDGNPVRGAMDFRNKFALRRIGEPFLVTVLRDGDERVLRAVVEKPTEVRLSGKDASRYLAGAVFANIPETSPYYGRIDGALIVEIEPGSPASRNGLRKDDLIVSVNDFQVRNPEDLLEATASGGRSLSLNIRRGNSRIRIVLR